MTYNLQRVKAPRLSGLPLKIFTALLENRLTRRLLVPGLLKSSGMKAFRLLEPNVEPTGHPPLPEAAPSQPWSPEDGIRLADSAAAAAADHRSPNEPEGLPTVVDFARAYRSGKVSPEQVARRVVEAIEASHRLTPPLRAIISCHPDDVFRQAAESARRLADGTARSVLEGVPVAIKDEMDLEPYPTTVGTVFLGREPAQRDSDVAARLRAAGALLVGKTNMYEIGIAPQGNNPHYGFARNPWNLQHDTGGSSSGCGNAVAAGIVPLAIGADGGGSVRVPAALCGVVGLKATWGRISGGGSAGLCHSVGHVGPLGRSVRDVAIGYAICAGPEQRDPITGHQPDVSLAGLDAPDLSGIRIGIYEPWFQDADTDIVSVCEQRLKDLETAGASLVKVRIDGLEEARLAHAVTILSEMRDAMKDRLAAHRRDFALPTRINLALAEQFTEADYLRAQRIRTQALAEWNRVLSEVDVVVTPATACPAPRLTPGSETTGESDLYTVTSLMHYMIPGNLCGLPAISFPAGFTPDGLPVGLQAIGRHWEEQVLLKVAHVAEHSLPPRKPPVCWNLLDDSD